MTNEKLMEEVIKGCEVSREKVILKNLKLVHKIASDFLEQDHPDYDDLVSWGVIGLMKGVDKYKLDGGAKLSSYSAIWIRQKMKRFLMNNKMIRVPIQMITASKVAKKAFDELSEKLGREPTTKELAVAIGCTEPAAYRRLNAYEGTDILEIEDQESLLGYEPEEPREIDVKSLLKLLNKRERDIIIGRFGLDGNKPLKLRELAEPLNLTRERIRQIEKIAIRKLKDAVIGVA